MCENYLNCRLFLTLNLIKNVVIESLFCNIVRGSHGDHNVLFFCFPRLERGFAANIYKFYAMFIVVLDNFDAETRYH